MIAWLKNHFAKKQERNVQKKFIWVAEQLELHITGRSDEAFVPIMALAGDAVAMWDDLDEDQRGWFRLCGDELAENLDRQGFRASIKLKEKHNAARPA